MIVFRQRYPSLPLAFTLAAVFDTAIESLFTPDPASDGMGADATSGDSLSAP